MKDRAVKAVKTHPYLLILLVIALAYRFSGIFWGLPPFSPKPYHPDEPKIIEGALNFPQDIFQRVDLRYPTGLHYLLGLLTWPAKKLIEFLGEDPFPFIYLSGRLLSITLGTATILLVYLLARKFYGKTLALVAAIALAFSMYHVTNSAWATTDVATSFFLVLYLYLLAVTLEKQSTKYAIFTGISLGMLVGVKYVGALAVIPLFVLIIIHEWQQPHTNLWQKLKKIATNKLLWTVGFVALGVFLITTPSILINPEAFVESVQFEQNRLAQSQRPLYEIQVWQGVVSKMATTLGFPLAIFAIAGFFISLTSCRKFELAMTSLVIIFLLYFGNALVPRYFIMIMPILAIFAARALLFFFNHKQTWVRRIIILVCAGVLAYSFLYSTAAVLSRYPDTRTSSANYIQTMIPPGATFGIAYTSEEYDYAYHLWRYPYIDFTEIQYVDFLEGPDYVLVSSYDSVQIVDTLQSGSLSENFVISESQKNQWYQNSPPSPAIFAFYQNLYFSDQPDYELLERFTPPRKLAPIEFYPPTIEIYQKRTHSP